MVTDTIHTVYSIVSEAELGFLPILETEKGQLAPSMAMYNFLADKFGKQADNPKGPPTNGPSKIHHTYYTPIITTHDSHINKL